MDDLTCEAVAAARVSEILARAMPESKDDFGCEDFFDPWDILPAVYGGYSSDFDRCALSVLSAFLVRDLGPRDLASHMFREMLCVADLCDYGTSPRGCFPTNEFLALLPDLVAAWRAYSALRWGEDVMSETYTWGDQGGQMQAEILRLRAALWSIGTADGEVSRGELMQSALGALRPYKGGPVID